MRLASGDWIGSDVFYQAPLYPYFLGVVYAIFGRDLLIVRIIQALVGSASCVLLGLACARLFSPPSPGLRWPGKRVGLVAGLALALWAPAIFFDSLLQKAVLDMFFMCLALWLIAGIRDQAIRDRGVGCARDGNGRSRAHARKCAAANRGDQRSGSFYERSTTVLRTFYVQTNPIVERPQNVRRTSVEQLLSFGAGPRDCFCARRRPQLLR